MIKRFPQTLLLPAILLVIALTWPTGLNAQRGIEAQPQGATSESRVALVIGNADYQTGRLRNPVNDSKDMAEILRRLGFEVITRTNADKRAMVLAIREFGKKLRSTDVGLFYYAGHGVQIDGRNYLIPIAANISTEPEVEFEAVNAERVLATMEEADNPVNIVMLDACRDNPLARSFRSKSRGLARMEAPVGSFVAYATAPNSVARDGEGRNGVFTGYLLKHIITPGIKIEDVLKRVRKDVMEETGNKQVPWQSSSLTGDFYFKVDVKATIEPTPEKPAPAEGMASQLKVPSDKGRTSSLLAQAEAHLKSDRLTTPAGANALESLREVLRLDPDNEEAGKGLKRIAGRYVEMAENQLDRGNRARARLFLDRAEKVVGGDQRVARVRARLEESGPGGAQPKAEVTEYVTPAPAISASDQSRLNEAKRELKVIRAGMDRIKKGIEQGQEATAETLDRLFGLTSRRKELESEIAGLERKIKKAREAREARLKKERAERERKKREARVAGVQADIDKYNRIAASTKDKALLRVAWQSLVSKYPEAKGLKQGDVKSLLMKAGYKMKGYVNSIGMRFVAVPPGDFLMGSPDGEGNNDEHPQHKVEITKAFLLGVTEVSQAQWQAVMGSNPSKFKGADRPVENVSWKDVHTFIRKLNKREGTDKYRLPTEAEWEYACRAGSKGKWTFGNDEGRLGDYARYSANSGIQAHPVGGRKPNAFGLFDIHGNVWEWCQDRYDAAYYRQSPSRDPQGPDSGSVRVIRGGSWDGFPFNTRCAGRIRLFPGYTDYDVGFRLARTF